MKNKLKSCLMIITFLSVTTNQLKSEDPVELRKISTSTILNGIACTCLQIAKLVCAKNKNEQKMETCNLASTVLQIAAEAVKENEESKKNKRQSKNNSQQEAQESEQSETETKSETKSINFNYLDQFKLLSDDQKIDYINEIFKSKIETAALLDEITDMLKNILIDELF